MSVIATSMPTVSPVLIIGAAGLLVGAVFTMVAPTPYYQPRERLRKLLERSGRIVSFIGAFLALFATTTQGEQPAHGLVAFGALTVAEVAMVLVLAPVAWNALKSMLSGDDEDGKQKPRQDNGAAALDDAVTVSVLALLAWRRLGLLILGVNGILADSHQQRPEEASHPHRTSGVPTLGPDLADDHQGSEP